MPRDHQPRAPERVAPPAAGAPLAWLLVAPLLLALAAYARVLHGEFVFDDLPNVVNAPAVRQLPAALRAFVPDLLAGRRPVTVLTLALDHAAGGLEPFTFHATNLGLHLLAVLLVFGFTRAVLRLAGAGLPAAGRGGSPAARAALDPDALALVVAGLFALHPLQSQAVSYVVQRAEVLASLGYLGALWLLLLAERHGPGWRGALAYGGALLALALGLGSKAILVTLPVAYLLLTWAVPGPAARGALTTWPRRLALLAAPVALIGLFAARTSRRLEGSTDAGFAVPGLPAGDYFLTQWRVVATYLRLLLWPAGQSADWAFSTSHSLGEPAVLLSGALLLALVAAAAALLWWSRRPAGAGGPANGGGLPEADRLAARLAAFGIGWFFVVLSATSSVIPREDVLVEHRTYLASWGVFLALAVAAERGLARLPARRRTLAALLLVGLTWSGLAALTWRRNAVWESALALWSDAAAKAPGKPRVHLGLGNALLARGEAEAAIAEYRLGLATLRADAAPAEAPLQQNLGAALARAGRPAEAVAPLRRALALDPRSADAAAGLAVALLAAGELEEAGRAAVAALTLRPEDPVAHRVAGRARLAAGDDDAAALAHLERAARAFPADAQVQLELGHALAATGRSGEACAAWARAAASGAALAEVRAQAAQASELLRCPPARDPR
ncbi:MAG: tetratricopeptide repeat protein [Anaeromyxobacter sp.]|nr:tetratricopeptide repeat protein [Anaeromyxobacter sp.]